MVELCENEREMKEIVEKVANTSAVNIFLDLVRTVDDFEAELENISNIVDMIRRIPKFKAPDPVNRRGLIALNLSNCPEFITRSKDH